MVADGASLLAAIPRLRPELLVVDLSLPVANGRNNVVWCGKEFPALAVVLSVHDEAATAAGARCFVLKRTAATDLAEAVPAVLEGGRYLSGGVGPRPGR